MCIIRSKVTPTEAEAEIQIFMYLEVNDDWRSQTLMLTAFLMWVKNAFWIDIKRQKIVCINSWKFGFMA